MKIKSGFVLEKVGNGYLAVTVGDRAKDFSGLVRMNETGCSKGFVWISHRTSFTDKDSPFVTGTDWATQRRRLSSK